MEWLIGFVILAWLMREKRTNRNRSSSGSSYKPARNSYVSHWQKKKKNLTSKRQLVSGGAETIDLLGLSKKQDLLIFSIWNFYGKFHGILLYW